MFLDPLSLIEISSPTDQTLRLRSFCMSMFSKPMRASISHDPPFHIVNLKPQRSSDAKLN